MFGNRNYQSKVLCGKELNEISISNDSLSTAICKLNGVNHLGKKTSVVLSDQILSKHILLLGGIGSGKTNVFNQMIEQIRASMTEQDILIIFDTKGDFYDNFYIDGDTVISNDDTAINDSKVDYWNLFNEIDRGKYMTENITEIAKMLFAEACSKTNQVFFPNAAKGLFEAILYHFIHSHPNECSNYWLMQFINRATGSDIRMILEKYPQYQAMSSYISSDDSPQTQGVLSELHQVCRNLFIGNFCENGAISLRKLIKQKQKRTVFIEYDMSVGKVLAPIYSLMIDLAIKEALSRRRSEGKVYFVIDEFALLPYLEHIDDSVNFGRSLGVNMIIGLQNTEQIYDSYDEIRGRSILSGFQTLISFYLNDEKSREYVQGVYGKNRKLESYMNVIQSKGMIENVREGFVIEDWDITNLKVGEAIIGLPEQTPFQIKFDLYKREGN